MIHVHVEFHESVINHEINDRKLSLMRPAILDFMISIGRDRPASSLSHAFLTHVQMHIVTRNAEMSMMIASDHSSKISKRDTSEVSINAG